MNIFILATCRYSELWGATAMVFKSLRVGFPNWPVTVFDNGLRAPERAALEGLCEKTASRITSCWTPDIHHKWIEYLLAGENEPFVILDTDVTFFDNMEHVGKWLEGPSGLAGRYVPAFRDEFTKCATMNRLHTSLLVVDPVKVRENVQKYFSGFPETAFNPRPKLIYPAWCPCPLTDPKAIFYDTTAMLYHAIGGERFDAETLDRYGHLNFGTISDIVAPHYPDQNFRTAHFFAFEHPEVLKGQWRKDDQWYAARKDIV